MQREAGTRLRDVQRQNKGIQCAEERPCTLPPGSKLVNSLRSDGHNNVLDAMHEDGLMIFRK